MLQDFYLSLGDLRGDPTPWNSGGLGKKHGFLPDFGKFRENNQKLWNKNSNPSWICALPTPEVLCALSWNFPLEKEYLGYSQWVFGMLFPASQNNLKIALKKSYFWQFLSFFFFFIFPGIFFFLSRKIKLPKLFPAVFPEFSWFPKLRKVLLGIFWKWRIGNPKLSKNGIFVIFPLGFLHFSQEFFTLSRWLWENKIPQVFSSHFPQILSFNKKTD